MRIAIAGAHGKIATLLMPHLIASGHEVIGLVRNARHEPKLRAAGARPVLCDLEHASLDEVAQAIRTAEAVVFAAGAGAGSGAERKLTMDRDGAIKLLGAAESLGIDRYVMVSAMGAEEPPDGDDVFSVYLKAKADADAALRESGIDWTIVRPGRLTDGPATGRAAIGRTSFSGEIAREDVAHLLALVIPDQRTHKRTLYVNGGGGTPLAEELERFLNG